MVPVSDTVIFCVELEHPFPDAYWTRNGERLKEDSRISIACVLRQYTLTIRDCQADDSGEVAFVAGDCKTSTRFSVTGEDGARVKNVFSHSAIWPFNFCQRFNYLLQSIWIMSLMCFFK